MTHIFQKHKRELILKGIFQFIDRLGIRHNDSPSKNIWYFEVSCGPLCNARLEAAEVL